MIINNYYHKITKVDLKVKNVRLQIKKWRKVIKEKKIKLKIESFQVPSLESQPNPIFLISWIKKKSLIVSRNSRNSRKSQKSQKSCCWCPKEFAAAAYDEDTQKLV